MISKHLVADTRTMILNNILIQVKASINWMLLHPMWDGSKSVFTLSSFASEMIQTHLHHLDALNLQKEYSQRRPAHEGNICFPMWDGVVGNCNANCTTYKNIGTALLAYSQHEHDMRNGDLSTGAYTP